MCLRLVRLLAIWLIISVSKLQGQGIPETPCPALFQYDFNGNEYFGIIELPSPRIGQTVKLNVIMSLRAQLPTSFVGALELFGSKEAALVSITQHRPIRYRVRFPVSSPLPRLTQILQNNQPICSGPPESGPVVTEIRLQHTLFTELAAQTQPFDPNNYAVQQNQPKPQDPFDQFYNGQGQKPQQTGVIDFNNGGGFGNNQLGFPGQQQFYEEKPPQQVVQQQRPPSTPQTVPQRPQRPQSSVVKPQATNRPTNTQSSGSSQNINAICGVPHERFSVVPLIVGGNQVSRGSWPWLVAVYLNMATSLTYQCGATLVSSRHVVTAAHCFQGSRKTYKEEDILLFIGRFNIMNWMEEGSVVSEPSQIIIHSDYMKDNTLSYDADIAMIFLKQSLTFTEYIRPVCLWSGATNIGEVEGRDGTVVGWGRDETGKVVTPEPKKVELPIVSEVNCLRSSDSFKYITSNRTFCAGTKDGRGPCNGDSGSGFLMMRQGRWTLRGIVSTALADPIKNTCNLSEYVVFTDAAKFSNWIRSLIG